MRRNLTFLLFFITVSAFAQKIQLSERARISVITCAPWQGELYSAFGHSAIRVLDINNQIDFAYNYGTFDFNQPNFYLNFTKGNLLYKLSVQSYPQFRAFYLYYGRWVHEQIIDLDSIQKQQLFDYLQTNAKPENQNYLYDYFYNNCATKIRDVFAEVLGDKLRFDDSYITTNYTIRDLTDIYLQEQPWGDLGIDICLGLPMDKKASPYEYMFLPDYIESSFNHAFIQTEEGEKPLVIQSLANNPNQPEVVENTFPHPWIVFGFVLVVISGISFSDFKRRKASRWLDVTLLTLTGLLGVLLFILWTCTDHKAAANNFNLLWALPTNLIAAFMMFGNNEKLLQKYFGFATILTVLTLLLWPFLPQQLNVYLVPMVVALAIRYALNYQLRKN